MRAALSFAILLCAALPAGAETYKWVDAKGVTNYSSTPPPGVAQAQVIEERVSVVPTEPSLAPAIAEMHAQGARRQEFVELAWLQRQRLMAEQPSGAQTGGCPYRADCSEDYFPLVYPYAYPYYAHAPLRGMRGARLKPHGGMRASAVGPARASRPSQGARGHR
jgi:hypothetical protein